MPEFLCIPAKNIEIDPSVNPRQAVTVDSCSELIESIKQFGIQVPICVHKEDEKYTVISGHRRYTSCVHIWGLETLVPCMVYEGLTRQQIQRMNLSENLDRKSLDFIEECWAIRKIFPDKVSYEIMGKAVGKSRQWCKVRWETNDLAEEVKEKIIRGVLTAYDVQQIIYADEEKAQGIIDAKEEGQSSRAAAKRKKSRNRSDIHTMLSRLMNDQVKVDCYRALAWAAGDIEDNDLLGEPNNEAE